MENKLKYIIKDYEQIDFIHELLSYEDVGEETIKLYNGGLYLGNIFVQTEIDGREFIWLNQRVEWLDHITKQL